MMDSPPPSSAGLRIRNPRDFAGGIALIVIAAIALWAARDLDSMRGFSLESGTAPRLLAIVLAGFGAVIAGFALIKDGEGLPIYSLRGPIFVIAAVLLFGLIIRPAGLVLSCFMLFLVSSAGSREIRWMEAVIGAAVMACFCALLFVTLLRLPFNPWPDL